MADNINATIEDLAASIDSLAQGMARCCAEEAKDLDAQPSLGEVSIGPGEQFETTSDYLAAKCNVSNAIYDTLYAVCSKGHTENVTNYIDVGFGASTVWFAVLAATGPASWALAGAVGAMLSILFLLVTATINFEDMFLSLDDQHEELVTALYNAETSDQAAEQFLLIIDEADPGITTVERQLLSLALTYKLRNLLFEPTEALAAYQSPNGVTCQCADTLQDGTDLGGGQYQATSTIAGDYRVTIDFNWVGVACGSPQDITVSLDSGSLTSGGGCGGPGTICIWRLRSTPTANDDIYQSDTAPSWPICTRSLLVTSQDPFTISIDRADCEL